MGQSNVCYYCIILLPQYAYISHNAIPDQERAALSGSRIPYRPQHPHKYPHSSTTHLGVQGKVRDSWLGHAPCHLCHLQIYDTESSEKLRSTDVVTFVGILTNDS